MSLLEVQGLNAGYGGVDVLHDIVLEVDQGELVTVIGANGAGKSTLLRTISGLVSASSGTVRFEGEDITGEDPSAIAARGIGHVPENRRVFPTHPVVANLRLGGWVRRRDKDLLAQQLELVYERFPILRERTNQPAGTLSGGQQQMLALGMALMARPKVLLLDEPSLGLAPLLVREIFEEIQKLKAEGSTILLVEQMAKEALKIADRALVLQLGRVRFQGPAAELRESPDVVAAYLG